MGMQVRGGIPQQRNLTIDATGRSVRFLSLTTSITIKVGGGAVRVFFSEDDFDDDANFREIASGEPFSEPIEMRTIWMKAVTVPADVQITAIIRKG